MEEIDCRYVTLKELSCKEVINTTTGERIGYVDDVEIDMECGRVCFFCITVPCKNPFSKNYEVKKFSFEDICKIGQETILIKSYFCVPNKRKNCCKI